MSLPGSIVTITEELVAKICADMAEALGYKTPYCMAFLDHHMKKLSEESGEAMGAYLRWAGEARRSGTIEEYGLELTDVIITSAIVSHLLSKLSVGFNIQEYMDRKLTIIVNRGYKDK